MSGSALPPDVPGSRGRFAIGPSTLVPIGVVGVAFALGMAVSSWNSAQRADVTAELVRQKAEIASLGASVELAKVEIIAKLDEVAHGLIAMGERQNADHVAMLTKDEFDGLWRLTRAIHPELSLPERK